MKIILLSLLSSLTLLSFGQELPIQKLQQDTSFYNQRFGQVTAVGKDIAAVSTNVKYASSKKYGAVGVYEKQGNRWIESATLTPSNLENVVRFGSEIAIAKGFVFVTGFKNKKGRSEGFVFVFKKSGEVWRKSQILKLEKDYVGSFGHSIVDDNNTVIISVKAEKGGNQKASIHCSAFIYELDELNQWALAGEITNKQLNGFQNLEQVVALDQNHAFVNGYFEDTAAEPVWFCTMTAKDTKGNIIMQSSGPCRSTSPMVFVYTQSGSEWENTQILKPWDNNGRSFGDAISAHGNMLAISAEHSKINGKISLAGKVYLYALDEQGIYQPFQIVIPKDSHFSQGFGSSIQLTEDYLIVGAEDDRKNENGLNEKDRSGACYIFRKLDGQFVEVKKIVSPKRQKIGNYARDIDIYKTDLIIGSGLRTEHTRNVMHDEGSAFIVSLKLEQPPIPPMPVEEPQVAGVSEKLVVRPIEDSKTIVLYPNPSTGNFTLLRNIADNSTVSIIDLKGNTLSKFNMDTRVKSIKLPFLASGIYHVIVETQNSLEQKKLVIVH